MLIPAIICGVACIVIGVPFTYYWFRFSDRWADEDQRRFHDTSAGREDRGEVRVIDAGESRSDGDR